jgi:hypothetical protein
VEEVTAAINRGHLPADMFPAFSLFLSNAKATMPLDIASSLKRGDRLVLAATVKGVKYESINHAPDRVMHQFVLTLEDGMTLAALRK